MPETPEIPEELSLADEAAATPSAPEGEAEGIAATEESAEIAAPGTVEIAATEEVAETAKENEPMIDIHVPQATHTWKDFWIHLGTIAAGLLIAISLEQSVEKLHQLHERHVLEAALHAEGESNKSLSEINIGGFDDAMTWYLGLHQDIQTMLATGGKADLPYRVMHHRIQLFHGKPVAIRAAGLTTAAWDTAAEDNRLTLLPDDMANAYSRLYSEEKSYADARNVAALAEDQQAAKAAYPDDYDKMAQEIEAENAARDKAVGK